MIPYSAYSPDLAPWDHYLYRFLARYLHSQRFNKGEEVEASVKEFFASEDKNWY